jgi:hypothetical protein
MVILGGMPLKREWKKSSFTTLRKQGIKPIYYVDLKYLKNRLENGRKMFLKNNITDAVHKDF